MKTNASYAELVTIILVLAPLGYLGLHWNQLPATIATHYGLNGQPDGWMPKETAALFVGGISVFLYLVLRFLPKLDPGGRLQTANFLKLRLVITCFFSAIMALVFYMAANQNNTEKMTGILLALAALMVAGVGNYLTTVKPNWFVGIRTPWTLQSDSVWRKTHRMGGRLMVAGGILAAILALVVPAPYTVVSVLGVVLLSALIPVLYSYRYFRQEKLSR